MWFEHKKDGDLAKSIRRDLRLYRREKGKGGHRFVFKDLQEIWSTAGDVPEHVLVTHYQDATWQHYWCHPERGWLQQGFYSSKDDAIQGVGEFTPPEDNFRTAARHPAGETETYMVVSVDGKTETWRSKAATSPWVQKQMTDVLGRVGFTTRMETVAASRR
jgi:hypothetical protein